jgi:hypothetical protein
MKTGLIAGSPSGVISSQAGYFIPRRFRDYLIKRVLIQFLLDEWGNAPHPERVKI